MFDKKTYQEAVSSLHASGEILREVHTMTHQIRKPFKLSRAIALAAVVAALCAAAAVAAVGFVRYENPTNMLQAFFGENVDSHEGIVEYNEYGKLITNMPAWERLPLDESVAQELVAPYLFAVGEQAVYGDYTLTVEAGLYDPAVGAGLLYYKVENPNGVSGYEVFPDGELWWPADAPVFAMTNAASRDYLDTASTTGTTLWLCTYFVTDFITDASNLQVSIGDGQNRLDMATVAVALFVLSAVLFVPVFIDYLHTSLVARFPTLFVAGFVFLSGLLTFFSGLILDTVVKKDRQDFELWLNLFQMTWREREEEDQEK